MFAAKVLHDSIVEHRPAKETAIAVVIAGTMLLGVCWAGWSIVDRIEWKNEIVIKMTFKSSPLFTKSRQEKIVWNLNAYYRYLRDVGFDLPSDIPPLGVSPPHSVIMGGGSLGVPSYYSSLTLSEDVIDDPKFLRFVYASYTFNRIIVWPDAYKPKLSPEEKDHDEVAAL